MICVSNHVVHLKRTYATCQLNLNKAKKKKKRENPYSKTNVINIVDMSVRTD